MAQTDSDIVEELPAWIKCKEVVALGEAVTIVDAEQFAFEDKTSAKYTVRMPNGELRALTMEWSDRRAKTVERIIRDLDNGADGVEATLVQLPSKDPAKSGYLLWDPIETDRTSDFKRAILADNAARKAGLPRDPMQSPEHQSWKRDQERVTDADIDVTTEETEQIPSSAFTEDEISY